MSYYYSYYIGYEKDGKIYPLGPYDSFTKIRPVIERSRSFASDLHEHFYNLPKEKASDELFDEFKWEDWKGETQFQMKYLPFKELPSGDYIKKGYFLISDVQRYERGADPFDDGLFYDYLEPTVYASLFQIELKFGKLPLQEDCEGNAYQPHSVSEYMFYAYPDKFSKEYESFILTCAVSCLENYLLKDSEIVILETEG